MVKSIVLVVVVALVALFIALMGMYPTNKYAGIETLTLKDVHYTDVTTAQGNIIVGMTEVSFCANN